MHNASETVTQVMLQETISIHLVCVKSYLHSTHIPRGTDAFSCLVVTGGTVKTLALQLATLAVVARLTGVLTSPALVAVCADTGPSDGVTQGSVLTLATVTAVRSPVATLTAWGTKTSTEDKHYKWTKGILHLMGLLKITWKPYTHFHSVLP